MKETFELRIPVEKLEDCAAYLKLARVRGDRCILEIIDVAETKAAEDEDEDEEPTPRKTPERKPRSYRNKSGLFGRLKPLKGPNGEKFPSAKAVVLHCLMSSKTITADEITMLNLTAASVKQTIAHLKTPDEDDKPTQTPNAFEGCMSTVASEEWSITDKGRRIIKAFYALYPDVDWKPTNDAFKVVLSERGEES